ncbi:HAD hydrolase-like protein, partial [Klebsiella pneumoniae]|nr:HAD hydrolase-like protein [Klebsiella pneumoniae]
VLITLLENTEFGASMEIINNIENLPSFNGCFVDIWGVLYDGKQKTAIADFLLDSLSKKGKVVLISNSSRTSAEMYDFLYNNNIDLRGVDGIVTSGDLIKSEIEIQLVNGRKYYIMGTIGESYWLKKLSQYSVSRINQCDFIITANHIYETDAELAEKISFIKEKAMKIYSTNPDRFVNLSGFIQKTGGYFCEMARKENIEIVEYGKPHKKIFTHALSLHGLLANETCMIGDSLETDIKGAQNSGLFSLLVEGYGLKHEFKEVSKIAPDFLFNFEID